MLSSPVWRGASRTYFTAGLMLGGVTTAVLAVALGSLLRPVLPWPVRAGLVAAMVLFVLAGEVGVHRISLPHRRSQVPSTVIGEGAEQGALRFGFEMGSGLRTHMPSNLPYLPLLAVALLAGWAGALAAGLGFGVGRAAMALGRHHGGDPLWWDAQWRRYGRIARIALAVSAAALAALLLRAAG